jgi:hypothetical protein
MTRLSRILVVLAGIVLAAPAYGQTLYGISNGFGSATANQIYQINPANADLTNIVQVTLPGFTITNSLAMSANPLDGTLFAVIKTSADIGNDRRLVTINPTTGVATNIGNLGDNFSSLAFRSNGVLYGVVGDGGINSETLWTINTSTASTTFVMPFGNGADGETIAFHPNGLLYHSSGNGTAVFESVNVDTQTVTPIGTASGEMFGMGYHPLLAQLLGSDIGSQLFSIDINTGARIFLGSMSDQLSGDNRALAFVAAVPEPATLAFLGAGLVAGSLYTKRRWKKRSKR